MGAFSAVRIIWCGSISCAGDFCIFTIAAVNFVYVINNVHENRLSMLKNEQNFDYKSDIFR